MPTKLEQLKAIIQKANPEIMELKFGCETSEGIVFTNQRGLKVEIYIEGDGRIEEYHISDLKILGRPIRLADVLIAIGQTERQVDYGYGEWAVSSVTVDSKGNFVALGGLDGASCDAKWNLKETLDHQSEETLNFLFKLFNL